MSIEFDIDAISATDFSSLWESKDELDEKAFQFHEKIYSPPYYPTDFEKRADSDCPLSSETEKADAIMRDQLEIAQAIIKSTKQCENVISLCKHKERIEIEHEVDDNGDSRTGVHGQAEIKKDGRSIGIDVWVDRNEGQGKSETGGGGKITFEQEF